MTELKEEEWLVRRVEKRGMKEVVEKRGKREERRKGSWESRSKILLVRSPRGSFLSSHAPPCVVKMVTNRLG